MQRDMRRPRRRRWPMRLPLLTAVLLLLLCVTAAVTAPSTSTAAAAAPPHDESAASQAAPWTRKDITYHTDLTVCPTCPMCARASTSMLRRLRYCNRFTAPMSAFAMRRASYRAVLAAFLPHFSHTTDNNNDDDDDNALRTAGSSNGGQEGAGVTMKELPFTTDHGIRHEALRNIEELLMTRVVGQPHIIPRLLAVLRRKLRYPSEPLVIHLAGDNGVGKTHTVRLISQALSLRCAGAQSRYYSGVMQGETLCEAGDNMLIISGTGFDGLPLPEARRRIVRQVIHHVQSYPHGIVLLDDLTAMDPALVKALAPLFGRATHFPEQLEPDLLEDDTRRTSNDDSEAREGEAARQSEVGRASTGEGSDLVAREDVHATRHSSLHLLLRRAAEPPPPLSQLLVFITTDFGQQGRTVGKSPQEIEALVRHEFRAVYGAFLPAYTRIFTYVTFSRQSAEAMVKTTVATLPCVLGQDVIAASTITPSATAFLVEKYRRAWEGSENGHALRRVVEDELIAQIVRYLEAYGVDQRLTARFVLQENAARVVLKMHREDGSEVGVRRADYQEDTYYKDDEDGGHRGNYEDRATDEEEEEEEEAAGMYDDGL